MAPDAALVPSAVPLLTPADGVPDLVTSAGALTAVAEQLAAGTGPVALDAERASGFRYSQRAYLVQLRRRGAGSFLVDPIPVASDMAPLAAALDGPEWVLHAASQDLPCLAELGLHPASVFDTELAGRLAGFERVGLAAMVERVLGLALTKGHGADDWSKRPLPHDWLVYAALDVEVLLELRDALAAELAEQGKTEWARQEFEHVRTAGGPKPKPDRWRRTSGIHKVRKPRQLAAIRELWLERDKVAAARDIAPGRVLPDAAIVSAAVADPTDVGALTTLPVFGGRAQRRQARTWLTALERARALPADQLPTVTAQHEGPPPVSRWSDRDPDAAARMTAARSALTTLSEQHRVPAENLLLPDLLRRVCWSPPADLDVAAVAEVLRAGGARPWQRELLAEPLAQALRSTADTAEAVPGSS
ncbi:ribonuclease D [Rhodococcus sp. X156]|uniref:ribonuclease D n=1 Tax=Rhodococcus sp. X156 TaxID=2499145 RepID=UPI0019D1E53C|nr:ribonuclease D [Rhodococcus sp. X156]